MKDPHEMNRLELEQEVIESRKQIRDLYAKIKHQEYVITVYSNFIEEHKEKTLGKTRKDWYD